jgi:hypothetical protein
MKSTIPISGHYGLPHSAPDRKWVLTEEPGKRRVIASPSVVQHPEHRAAAENCPRTEWAAEETKWPSGFKRLADNQTIRHDRMDARGFADS